MLPTYVSRQPLLLFPATLMLFVPFAFSSTAASEPVSLAVLLRQLDLIERQAEASARLPHDDTSRYHFDYTRFRDDVQRMRQGIRDHLSPQRAQPRDPLPLSGDYRRETEANHEPE
ncbi:RAQPRD family integrative conjugative element protein [Pseudomonas sp. S3E17]|uniref:integrative conjugative element protein, RAQPRD family n=1 Tax=Pseudomonas sp. S3E17 TaxID=2817893 RepID=UPI00209D4BF1|nr:RAQPRD family integrative conjugative element protein [Pseudomonas sp. S3E17]MCP1463314.1 RAQPRD family integrative conjugative element protein [Pseudomonas sp. S3E17]